MNTISSDKAEVIRTIARWGSVVAALVYAGTFVTDQLTWRLVAGQAVQIALVVLIFVGYAVAWVRRWELFGSLFALAATIAAYAHVSMTGTVIASPLYLLVGVPALLYLIAHFYPHQQRHSVAT